MIHLAKELHYISGTECDLLLDKAMEISKTISGLIKTL